MSPPSPCTLLSLARGDFFPVPAPLYKNAAGEGLTAAAAATTTALTSVCLLACLLTAGSDNILRRRSRKKSHQFIKLPHATRDGLLHHLFRRLVRAGSVGPRTDVGGCRGSA